MATVTAKRNVARIEREARRQKIADEQARLDLIAEGKRNARRVKQLDAARAARLAATIGSGSTVTFTVPDGKTLIVTTVSLSHEEAVVRSTARAAAYALVQVLLAIESERITAAQTGGIGPNVTARLGVVLDGDECRAAAKFGSLVSEIRG